MLTPREQYHQSQESLYLTPDAGLAEDLTDIYDLGKITIGCPEGLTALLDIYSRNRTAGFIGIQYGDEGKGRIVDNKIDNLLSIDGVKLVYVLRYNGGANAGHTIMKGDEKFAVHQLPSGILYPEAVGVMDQGMVIHPEDLKIEIEDIEKRVGDLRGKLFLSEEAVLLTDLERAEEVFNRKLSSGKSSGGTGRGISPGYAHFYDRLGVQVKNLMADNWRDVFGTRYDRYQKLFGTFGFELANMEVPDLRATRTAGEEISRKVGNRDEFLDRLENVRKWFIERDEGNEKKMITDTMVIHREALNDLAKGIIFEGAQGMGLHPWLGARPDVTSSDMSLYGVAAGTGIYRYQDIKEKIGVFKVTYATKVPPQDMPTAIPFPEGFPTKMKKEEVAALDKYIEDNRHALTLEQIRALWIVKYANEIGTTTGRVRGIQNLDLEVMRYNARMGGIEFLAGTHLDVAREDEKILVCTHYEQNGHVVPYRPCLEYQKGVKPHYESLPGWDGQKVKNAKSLDEIPDNAKKFLAFIQKRTGYPIVAVTTGPERNNLFTFTGQN